jgi:predicted transcriptional regulator of viral defense system
VTGARVFDRERALLDCFALVRRFGGLAEGLGILEDHRHSLDIPRLVAHALRYGKAAVARRVGLALERVGVVGELVAPLAAVRMQGARLLDPTRLAHGEHNRRWGMIENLAAPRRP